MVADKSGGFFKKYGWTIIVLFILLPLFLYSIFPTGDGSAHVYNAQILKSLITEKDSIYEPFFHLNDLTNPNWPDHMILAFLGLFLTPLVSEKVFLFLYVIIYVMSIRAFYKSYKIEVNGTIILNLSMIISFLFLSGFYNFSLGVVAFIWCLVIYKNSKGEIWTYISISAMFVFLFYSNLLLLAFTGLLLGLGVIFSFLKVKDQRFQFDIDYKKLGYSYMKLGLASLPALVLTFNFYKKSLLFSSTKPNDEIELIHWLLDFRPIILFSYGLESIFTQILLILIICLVVINLGKISKEKVIEIMPLGIVSIISLILLFVIPAKSGAGMMTFRFSHIFFLLFILMIGFFIKRSKKTTWLLVSFGVVLSGLYLSRLRHISFNARQAKEVIESAHNMPANSIVLPVRINQHWLQLHFSNYLSYAKPFVILENYEASMEWFPISWKNKKFGGLKWKELKDAYDDIPNSSIPARPDYLYLYGKTDHLGNSEFNELRQFLEDYSEMIYSSPDNYIKIYKFNDESKLKNSSKNRN